MIEKSKKGPKESVEKATAARIRSHENRKNRFLKAYIACAYNISEACKKAGIQRRVIDDWKTHDPEFANKMWEVEESITDFVESQMLKQIRHNNPAMIMWFLETKGKDRGYTRKFEMENNVKIELSTEQIDAMVKAHQLADKDETGKLKMPLRLNSGKVDDDTTSDSEDRSIDAEYRETDSGKENTAASGGSGSEVSGPQ